VSSSDLSLVLPNVGAGPRQRPTAPRPSAIPSTLDPPQMSIVRADPVAGSRRAWVTVLGITIVFETAVLWIAACLSLWRRRMTGTRVAASAGTGSRGAAPRPQVRLVIPRSRGARRARRSGPAAPRDRRRTYG
jgi:hypothetical protein